MAAEAVMHTFNAILFSYEKGQNWAISRDTSDPETVTQRQVSHQEKSKYHTFPVAQMVKNLPVMQGTKGQSLHQEDPLQEGMETHSSILAWRVPWTEEPGG